MAKALVSLGSLLGFYFLYQKLLSSLSEVDKGALERGGRAKQRLLQRIRRRKGAAELERKLCKTSHHEDVLMGDLVFPEQINVGFEDIGGLGHHKRQIQQTVLFPLQARQLMQDQESELIAPPTGVLFYGPPGTGKTMMAKAIAKTTNAAFLNLRLSTIQNKWYGESLKLVRALFSLAKKLSPTIIFIDEMDGFLQQRGGASDNHEASSSVKSEFLTLWDGILSQDAEEEGLGGERPLILIIGATNRPQDIDEAFLRRMPRRFPFNLPDTEERKNILELILKNERLDENLDIAELARITLKYSGSDLRELCKYAAMIPVQEVLEDGNHEKDIKTRRPLTMADFILAQRSVKPTVGERSFIPQF